MTDVVSALQDATSALNNAVQVLQTLAGQVQTNLTNTTTQATTIINNFLGRPPTAIVFVDPVNGDDTKDGTTPALAKKSLDTVLAAIGTTGTTIKLLNDALIQNRTTLYAAVEIHGVQASNNASGYIYVNRTITFLGTAVNSPAIDGVTYCSGVSLFSSGFNTLNINFVLPDQVPSQGIAAHIYAAAGTSFAMSAGTITATSSAAGFLLGTSAVPIDVAFTSMTLGTNAPGHVFKNIAAGGNPNSVFSYRTNITSA